MNAFNIGVTEDCNLSCDYCYVNKHANSMKLDTMDAICNYISKKVI